MGVLEKSMCMVDGCFPLRSSRVRERIEPLRISFGVIGKEGVSQDDEV